MSRSGLLKTLTVFLKSFWSNGVGYARYSVWNRSNGTGYSRYSRSSRCSGLLSGARDAERPTSSKCHHDCRLPCWPEGESKNRIAKNRSGPVKVVRVILISRYPNAIGMPTKSGQRTAAKTQT
jgi:hypothetical protein